MLLCVCIRQEKSIKLKLDTLVVIPIYVICKFQDKMFNR